MSVFRAIVEALSKGKLTFVRKYVKYILTEGLRCSRRNAKIAKASFFK